MVWRSARCTSRARSNSCTGFDPSGTTDTSTSTRFPRRRIPCGRLGITFARSSGCGDRRRDWTERGWARYSHRTMRWDRSRCESRSSLADASNEGIVSSWSPARFRFVIYIPERHELDAHLYRRPVLRISPAMLRFSRNPSGSVSCSCRSSASANNSPVVK